MLGNNLSQFDLFMYLFSSVNRVFVIALLVVEQCDRVNNFVTGRVRPGMLWLWNKRFFIN